MKTRTFTPPQWCGTLSRPLFLFILSFTLALSSCDKSKDIAQPSATELSASQAQDTKKDDDYKRNKTGQYVSKDVQVTGYEDGSERPIRPKFDAVSGEIGAKNVPICDPCDGGGGTYNPPQQSYGMVTSEQIGGYGNYVYTKSIYQNAIMDLKIRKGHDPSINTSDLPGYYKIPVDLNKGAGGRYIYLCFTRDPAKVQGSSGWPNPWVNSYEMGRDVPVRRVETLPQGIGYPIQQFYDFNRPPIEAKDQMGGFYTPDLNDGAGGKYIYAYQQKGADTSTSTFPIVKEVGIIYGNSSSIQPPYPWVRQGGDLNEGAGGDYIYFIVKY